MKVSTKSSEKLEAYAIFQGASSTSFCSNSTWRQSQVRFMLQTAVSRAVQLPGHYQQAKMIPASKVPTKCIQVPTLDTVRHEPLCTVS